MIDINKHSQLFQVFMPPSCPLTFTMSTKPQKWLLFSSVIPTLSALFMLKRSVQEEKKHISPPQINQVNDRPL